jgi:DNA-binding MarR family transcriptional regulator
LYTKLFCDKIILGGVFVNEQILQEQLRMFEKKLGELEKKVISCCELTFSQCNAIIEIGKSQSNLNLNQLAERLSLDSSTTSQTVNKLVNNELLERKTNQKDRRYITLHLTTKGQKLFDSVISGIDSYYKYIFNSIPENKRSQIGDSLEMLIKILSSKNPCKEGDCAK